MKFDRNEKTIKMALSFSESDDSETTTLWVGMGGPKIKNRMILPNREDITPQKR